MASGLPQEEFMTQSGTSSSVARPKVVIESLGMAFRAADGTAREVLQDVNLIVGANEFVAVVGPSGTGKTTLLRCIAGLERPTAGSVSIDGQTIDGPPAKLAMVFQEYGRSLFPWLSVFSNVTLPLRNRKDMTSVERASRAQAALGAVGLSDAARLYPWQLSGGMQQRVAIARAIACEPEVLVMDEPFASVDAETRSNLEDLVLRIRREYSMSVVLVTHDVDESIYMADRVAVVRGKPASIQEVLDIDLPKDRDQVTTKALPQFISLRSHVLRSFMSGSGSAAAPEPGPSTSDASEEAQSRIVTMLSVAGA
jgi:NitT/TauT family transport system ATP-binding protein